MSSAADANRQNRNRWNLRTGRCESERIELIEITSVTRVVTRATSQPVSQADRTGPKLV